MLALATSSGTGLMMSSDSPTEHWTPHARAGVKHCTYRALTYPSIGSTYDTASTLHDHLGGPDCFPKIPLEFNSCFSCTLTIVFSFGMPTSCTF